VTEPSRTIIVTWLLKTKSKLNFSSNCDFYSTCCCFLFAVHPSNSNQRFLLSNAVAFVFVLRVGSLPIANPKHGQGRYCFLGKPLSVAQDRWKKTI